MSAAIKIESGDLVSFQDQLATLGVVGRQRVLGAMGQAVKGVVVDHLARIGQDEVHHLTATRLGARRTNLYGKAAAGTHVAQITEETVEVSINSSGIAQRYFGGPIEAKTKQWLTIPAVADAYGKPASSFNNLQFILFRPDLAALVEKPGQANTLGKRTRKDAKGIVRSTATTSERGRVVYWLKKSVQQAADPSVLPTDDEMVDAATSAAAEVISFLKGANDGD